MGELTQQAEARGMATADLNAGHAHGSVPRVFASAQALLGAAAMISKLLWPQPPKPQPDGSPLTEAQEEQRVWARDRGRILRGALEIKSVPLLEGRQVRNSLEHFDDRLDKLLQSGDMIIADRNIAPRDDRFF